MLLSVGIMSAQSNVIDKHFQDYKQDHRFTKVSVAGKTFELFNEVETKSTTEQELVESIQKIEGIRGLFMEKSEEAPATYRQGHLKITNDADYEELMSVQNSEHNGIVMIKESAGTIEELVAMFSDLDKFGIFTIYGDLELQAMRDLATVIEENGEAWFKTFEKLDTNPIIFGAENSKGETLSNEDLAISIYPNPATDFVMLKSLNDSDANFTIGFYSLLGDQIQADKKVQLPYQLELKDVPQGSYFVRITNAAGEFRNYKIVKP